MIPEADVPPNLRLSQGQKDTALENLEVQGYFILKGAFPVDFCVELARAAVRDEEAGRFRPARIGKNPQLTQNIRSDQIRWWDRESAPARLEFQEVLEDFRQEINRQLQLGLWDFEMHDAVYREGQQYERHLDTFAADGARVVSMLLYLNTAWKASWGGQLVIHTASSEIEILPEAGTFVGFLSREIEHEVRPTCHDRRSIAAWFRHRRPL